MNGDRSPVFPQSPLLARALPGCVRIAKMCLGIFVLGGAAMARAMADRDGFSHSAIFANFADYATAQIRLSIGSERGDCYIDPAREKTV